MTEQELQQILKQLSVLKTLQGDYGHKTMNNVIQSLEAKVKYYEETINKRRYGI